MTNSNLIQKVHELPRVPGCYLFKNENGVIIYVGKAKDLKSRVGSYFQTGIDAASKTGALIQRIRDIEYIEAASELEAFILEAELIKKYRPKYNISLKDDKSYLYVVIKKELNLPKLITARKTDLKAGDISFGPYPDGTTAKYIVRSIRKLIPFRDCSMTKFLRYQKLKKPCLYGDIGLCSAPCVNFAHDDLSAYKKNISQIKKLLSGETSKVISEIKTQMGAASKTQEYEKAARYRDLLHKFEYIRQNFHSAQEYIENPYLLEDLARDAILALQKNISVLKSSVPERIECYDIANISGKEAVGSMVVAINGKVDKREYRKFRIKFKNEPDDFEMMREVLSRRLKREAKTSSSVATTKVATKWGRPDLIVLDGGKGQLSAGLQVLEKLQLSIPIIGLAKKFETIVYKDHDNFEELVLSKDNPGLKLLITLRDEAHRFAQKYHHKLRSETLSK